MPVYNGERYLREAVDSILAQNFTDFELILCDNASTDGTADICRNYARQDSRVRYHRNRRNIGLTANFEMAANLSSAPFVKWAAYDDVLDPTCLSDCVELLLDRPDVVLAVPAGRLIGASGEPVPPPGDILRPIVWPLDVVGRVTRYIDMLTAPESIAVMLYLFGLFRVDGLRVRMRLAPYPMSDQETLLTALLAGRFQETANCSQSIRIHTASSGSGIHEDPVRIWRTMHPDEPPAALIALWHHRHHQRIIALLAAAPLPVAERRQLIAHYVYRVGREIAVGKAGALRRRLPALGRPVAALSS